MNKILSFCVIFITIALFNFSNVNAQTIFINEICASNSTTLTDPDFNEYGDWIELYNSGNSQVNIKNYYITDDRNNPTKFKFSSDVIIEPNGYKIIWADDHNTGIHANFKLSASGEFLGLFNSSAQVIDSLTFPMQQANISYGSFPDGTPNYFFLNPTSPNNSNPESSLFNRLPEPVFSKESGFYTGMPILDISSSVPDSKIYFTLDGSIPTTESSVFQNTLHLASTLVIKAIAVKEGFTTSKVATKTYFINESSDLPIFSISTNPENFFSDTSGIYVAGTNGIVGNCSTAPRNWNQDWERLTTIEFFETNKERVFNVDAGVKIYGGCSRLYPQKSLGFYFRGEYGFNKLKYRLFLERNITEYNNFILRSSGQDWWRSMFRDAFVQTVVRKNTNVDNMAYRPAVLFINGDYWGIHNVREKLNEHYVEEHYQITEDNLDLIEYSKGITANVGDKIAYDSMMDYFNNNSLTNEENYNYIDSILNISDFIDYQIMQIYGANADWPGSNTKLWHARDNSVKWRFMIYDTDFTFGGNGNGQYNSNTLALATNPNSTTYPNPTWSTLMLRKLLENVNFKNEFIQRFAAHINNTFEPNYIISIIDSMQALIASEIPKHKLRWTQSVSYTTGWENNVQIMRDFANQRPAYIRDFIKDHFSLSGTYNFNINSNNVNFGTIYINNINIKNNFTQVLFNNIPVVIKAEAKPGYKFLKWEGVINSHEKIITLTLSQDSYIYAVFEKDNGINTDIVINEINFKSYDLFDTGDWIELYNPSDYNIDLSNWKITDLSGNSFTISQNTVISPKDYFVFAQDTLKFKSLYLNFANIKGNFDFGLSSSEDKIILSNNNDEIVDEVHYNASLNWNLSTIFTGNTLSLKNPTFDNSLPENWLLSNNYGTPGKINDTYTKLSETENNIPSDFILYQNYPNPFNPSTTIKFSLPTEGYVTLNIFNTLGEKVYSESLGKKSAGTYQTQISLSNLSSGLYIYSVTYNGINNQTFSKSNKMLLLK